MVQWNTSSEEIRLKNTPSRMCRITLKFFADLLYLRGNISFEAYDDILSAKSPFDLDQIIEKDIRGEYCVKEQRNNKFKEKCKIIEENR